MVRAWSYIIAVGVCLFSQSWLVSSATKTPQRVPHVDKRASVFHIAIAGVVIVYRAINSDTRKLLLFNRGMETHPPPLAPLRADNAGSDPYSLQWGGPIRHVASYVAVTNYNSTSIRRLIKGH